MDILRALVLLAVTGCGLDIGASQPWVPIEDVGAPLGAEQAPVPPPNAFRSAHPAAADPLRVVTYNVYTGVDVEQLAAAIVDDPELAGAGVWLLQEQESYGDEPGSRTARLAALLGLGHVYVPARVKERDGDGVVGTHGLAILSAFPITSTARMELPDPGRGRPRIAIAADIDVGGKLLHVVDVHLETYLNAGQRTAQLDPAITGTDGPTLIAGDFNTSWIEWVGTNLPVLSATRASDQAPIVDSYMRSMGFDAPSSGSGPTHATLGLESRLDSFYVRGLTVTFGRVNRIGPSDHWPMWIDVAMP